MLYFMIQCSQLTFPDLSEEKEELIQEIEKMKAERRSKLHYRSSDGRTNMTSFWFPKQLQLSGLLLNRS